MTSIRQPARFRSALPRTLGWMGLMAGSAATVYSLAVRPWLLRWGATLEEVRATLPGDELVPGARIAATHAVSIAAAPDRVWPWLVQMGQGRGGFYSYDRIENAMGLDIHTVDGILPEYQDLQVGDLIPLAPDGMGLAVARLQPEQALVLHGDSRIPDGKGGPPVKPGEFLAASWGFYLRQQGAGRTRLVERFRCDFTATPLNHLLYNGFLEAGAFLMERKMLLGIKERAERL
jgi:hypothetical protein